MNKIIQRKFRISRGKKTLPLCARRGKTRETLAELFFEIKFNTGVEIGTHKGKYAEMLCSKNPYLHLFCIDPWVEYSNMRIGQVIQDAVYQEALSRLSKYNVTILKKTSMEAIIEFDDESLDFVYIDGNHDLEYALEDITKWSDKVKSGGIIACHDYYNIHWPGVTKAVDLYIAQNNIPAWYATRDRLATAFWVKP